MIKKKVSLEGEEWRPVIGFEGLYEVSNYGRVASLNYMRTGNWRLLNQSTHRYGYQQVTLCKDGKQTHLNVHRLVAMAFPEICGEWFEGAEIDHINTITYDNRAFNLRWCTKSENQLNPITRKRRSKSLKNRPDQSKPVLQYDLEGNFIAEYQSIAEAARQTEINNACICWCCSGKYKTGDGYVWKYA